MFLTLKLKIFPDNITKKKLWEVSNRCTELWNACLCQRQDPNAWRKVNVHNQKKENPKKAGHIVLFDPGCRISLTGIKTDGTLWKYDLSPLRKVNLIRRYESAVWQRLPERIIHGSYRREALGLFSYKLQEFWQELSKLVAS
ncbi:MAG: hypothetical protein HQK54_03285 [Oligoflexales bacterium]|nr:hypothetical protein [Oligoflexales bacterium]